MQKPANETLSITDFANMSDEDVKKYVCEHGSSEITELLLLIRQKRAVRWDDRAILQMVEKSPLTFWASDKAYRVVLWAGKCSQVYSRELIGKPFPEIMSIYERSAAMKDSLGVIDADAKTLGTLLADFKNYYTKDLQGRESGFKLVTNSIQLIDDETGEKYYAEIGLPIDLEEALAEHEKRQKDFSEKVNAYESEVKDLKAEFSKILSEFSKKIRSESILSNSQKRELRNILNRNKSVIDNNLDKYKAASNFELFLQSNEEAIDSATNEIDMAFKNAIGNKPQPVLPKQQADPQKLLEKIDNMSDVVNLTFTDQIQKKTGVSISPELNTERSKTINELQKKKNDLLRELTEMKESIASSTSDKTKNIVIRIEAIESEMREFIDAINCEKKTNGKTIK